MNPALSIVIVNWNGAADLRRCLAALALEGREDVETIVVDNGSTDDSRAVARALCPQAVLVGLARNHGFAHACNRGLALARAPWILTLNNDTEVQPGCLARLLASADVAPADVGMIQPRLLLRGRGRLNSTGVRVQRDGSAHDRDFGAPLDSPRPAGEVLCITAGAGLYRRTMVEEARVGGTFFDEGFHMYFEDVDAGWRCRLAGWRAVYVPEAGVDHAFQASSRRRGRHFVTIQCMQNRVRTLLKNASWRFLARSLPRTASDLLWLLQHAGGNALARWLAGAGRALRQRPQVSRLARTSRRALERRWILASDAG